MQQITFDKFQKNLISVFDNVLNNQEPISVSLEKEREVVILDADDYHSIMETLYLLGNAANAERLYKGMRQKADFSGNLYFVGVTQLNFKCLNLLNVIKVHR